MPSSRFQQVLKTHRENPQTARAGLKWEDDEDGKLLNFVKNGVSIENIAKALQRTEGSIKTRLIIYGLNKMEKEGTDINSIAEEVNLTVEDFETYQKKKEMREERRNTRVVKDDNTITNKMIYSALIRLEKKFDAFIAN